MNKYPPKEPINYSLENIETKVAVELLIVMLRIRKFEEQIVELLLQDKIITPCHLCIGQEAVAAGVCAALRSDDCLFGTHRSHGHYLAKGGGLKEAMAEIFGRATGCAKGRGGSMHLFAKEVGVLGTSSIVAGSLPLAAGVALAEKLRHSSRVSVVFHGDGVVEEGAWNETANFAAVKKLPLLFVCENNLYCTHMPLETRRKFDNIAELATAHGVAAQIVDGNNVLTVYVAAQKLVNKIRQNSEPQFLECRTYRWLGHVGPHDNIDVGLRSKAELGAWQNRCPIDSYVDFLCAENVLTSGEVEDIEHEIEKEIKAAVEFAEQSAYPDSSEVNRHVFVGAGPCACPKE